MSAFFLGLLAVLLALSSLFMILLILVQRGRGGGITGALGGAGGQSAFGSKAGDMFTRITVGTAVVWIFLAMITISVFNAPEKTVSLEPDDSGMSSPETGDANKTDETNQPGVTDEQVDPLPGEGNNKGDSDGTSTKPGDPGLNPPKQDTPAQDSSTKENGNSAPAEQPKTGAPEAVPPASTDNNSTSDKQNEPPAETPKKDDSAGGG